MGFRDPFSCSNAIEHWHLHVHHNNIGAQFGGEFDRLLAIGGSVRATSRTLQAMRAILATAARGSSPLETAALHARQQPDRQGHPKARQQIETFHAALQGTRLASGASYPSGGAPAGQPLRRPAVDSAAHLRIIHGDAEARCRAARSHRASLWMERATVSIAAVDTEILVAGRMVQLLVHLRDDAGRDVRCGAGPGP